MVAQQQNIQVVLLGETKLAPGSNFRMPNFFVYRRDEVCATGPYRGTAVLVRRDLIHEELELTPFLTTRSIGVRTRAAGREVRLFAAYRPPYDSTPLHPPDLHAVLNGEPTLLAGDLNAKHPAWNSRSTNRAGRTLLKDSEDQGYSVIGPTEPTNIPTNASQQANVLDIVLHQNLPFPVHVEVLYDLNTQHLPILVVLGDPSMAPTTSRLRQKVDWKNYREALEDMSIEGPLTTPEEVEQAAHHVKRRIQQAKEAATKTSEAKTQRYDELPPHLKADLRRKRELHALWARTRCPRTKTFLNRVAEKLSADVKDFRGTTWEKLLDHVGEYETSLYHLNRQLTRTKEPICPLINREGRRCYDDSERAETLAEHLETQFTPHPVVTTESSVLEHHAAVEERVREFLLVPTPPLPGDCFISPAELAKAVVRLPNRKAPGPDGIPTAALKQLPRRGITTLARLFNGVLRTSHFPEDWKAGKVIVLPKPGKDRRQPSSYRPITLLSHVAKLFERLLLRRIRPHIQLRDEQYGFRGAHSTTLQLTRVLHHLADERNRERYTVGVFLDIEKAFDRVWHPGLLFKLLETTLPPGITRILASFLDGRHFYVDVAKAASSAKPIIAGVPQGSCLSPALYALYTNDIPTLEGRLQEWEEDVELALFADDSAYFASSRKAALAASKMQRVLDLLPVWLDKWRMAVNVGKTAAILTGQQRILPPPLSLRGQQVNWTSSVKYLGCHIDRALRMVPMVTHVTNQAKGARALLRPVLKSRLPLRTKLKMYKTYIRPRLTYAAPAWYALTSRTQRKKLQIVQNLSLRMVVDAGRYVRNDVIARDLRISSVEEFVRSLARRMYDRADNGPHAHLQNIAPHHARPPDERRRAVPRDLLRSPTPEEDDP
ncbi:hypothetical protein O0L34_g19102 [Tuta absoluta]|nr:hypothetical protein O0L34_g19102 [Tuta absoluta]